MAASRTSLIAGTSALSRLRAICPAGCPRRDACHVQRLTHIDIAEPRHDPLIEQQSLDRRFSPCNRTGEILRAETITQRLRPKCCKGRECVERRCLHEIERAEPARIIERDHAARPRFNHQMIVLPASSGSTRQRPTCRGERSAYRRGPCRSDHISRGAKGRVTRAPVIRCRRSTGIGQRRSARRGSTRVSSWPSSTSANPRTVVSTSGSSGMEKR